MSTTDARAYVRANKTLFVTLLLVLGMGVANAAWTAAPGNPPGSNATEPLNVSATTQTKLGNLNTLGERTGSLVITGTTTGQTSFTINGTKGFFPPRLTTAERTALAPDGTANSVLTGLTVYNSQLKQLEIFNGLNWVAAATTSASVWTNATSSPLNGINLTKGCFAINNVCVGNATTTSGGGSGGSGSATTTIEQGPAVRATFSTANSLMPLSPIPFNVNVGGGDFVIGTQWNTTSGGNFSPKVAGQYLVTVHLEVGECTTANCYVERASPSQITSGVTVTLDVKKNGVTDKSITVPLEVDKGYDVGYQSARNTFNGYFYPKTVEFSHLMNVAANETISVNASAPGTMYAIGTNGKSYISIVRVGSSLFFNPTVYEPVNVPMGGIIFFNGACPSGWSEYTALQGRYPVGAPSGGSVGAQVGTALTNQENRPAGQHTHSFSDYYLTPLSGGLDTGQTPFWHVNGYSLTSAGNTTNSGNSLVAGTNAPYVQLRACQKI